MNREIGDFEGVVDRVSTELELVENRCLAMNEGCQ